MSLQDPVSDMLVRISNALSRQKPEVCMPSSKLKRAIADILYQEGYISGFQVQEQDNKHVLEIKLKYYLGKPVIEMLRRVSKPSLRRYVSTQNLPKVMNGLGVAIISTAKGVMTDKSARLQHIGGEVLCIVL